MNRILAIATTTMILTATTSANAQEEGQRSTARGLSVGVHSANTALVLVEDRTTSYGGGFGVAVGYGFTDRFAVHSVTSGTFMPSDDENYVLSHHDLEARYSFASATSAWMPHLALGMSARTRHLSGDTDGVVLARAALAITAGGGVSYYLRPAIAVDWTLRYSFGDARQPSCPDAAAAGRSCAVTMRSNFGVSWFPMSR